MIVRLELEGKRCLIVTLETEFSTWTLKILRYLRESKYIVQIKEKIQHSFKLSQILGILRSLRYMYYLETGTILWRILSNCIKLPVCTPDYDPAGTTLVTGNQDWLPPSWNIPTSGRNTAQLGTSRNVSMLSLKDWWLNRFQTWSLETLLALPPGMVIRGITQCNRYM